MISRAPGRKARFAFLAFGAFIAVVLPKSAAEAQQPQWPCVVDQPTMTSTIPNDTQRSDQETVNCFAWQEFIGLNWPADAKRRGTPDPKAGPANFGNPNATMSTVWETFKNKSEVFLRGGVKPKSWNDPPPRPRCAASAPGVRELLAQPGVRVLDDTQQALGGWLADQAGNLIYYEIEVNKDEFDSIVVNGFYNGDVQNQTAATGINPTPGGQHQVKLPAGCNAGSCPGNGPARTGAIEIKAAWRMLTDRSQYGRYLTARAVLVDQAGACSQATMGLIGLHIIHKTVTQPQFIWATFEHVDNVPPASPSTFNNPNCRCEAVVPAVCGGSQTTFQNCAKGQTQGQTCSANVQPPGDHPPNGNCPAYPIQVTRNRPISNDWRDPVAATNMAARAMLTARNRKSVFQYYELIDVLWSTSSQDSYTNERGQPGPRVPLPNGGLTPDVPVASTTMETYVQTTTCLVCHRYAAVPAGPYAASGDYASDFSLILGYADLPSKAPRSRRRWPPGP